MKMKKMRKGVAAILAIALLITLTPVMALTDDEPDTETLLTNAECVVSSETANTQDAVTNWIKANWLLGISGLDDVLERDYGVEISDLKMTTPTDPFTAAVDGTVESPEGSAGQLKFSVVVPGADGVGTPQLTVSKTCTITPKKYIPKIQVKSTVLSRATAGVSYSLSLDGLLADGFSADLVSWTKPSTALLPEGLTFSAEDGKISGTPTTAGTYTLSGIQAAAAGGQYQSNIFSFTLTVAEAADINVSYIVGNVMTKNGTPLSGYDIVAINNEGKSISVKTQVNGSYRIPLQKSGSYKIGISGMKKTTDNGGFEIIEVSEGQSVNHNIRLSTDRIVGALTQKVNKSDGGWVTVETVPTGNSKVIKGDTMSVNTYTLTRADIKYAAESVAPEIPIEEITVPDGAMTVEKSVNYYGINYKLADIIEIKGQKYIFHYGSNNYINLVGVSDGGLYTSIGDNVPGVKNADANSKVIEKNSMVNINGAIYHVRYEFILSGRSTRYLYAEDKDGKMVPAGIWEVDPVAHVVYFNQGCTPNDVRKNKNVTFVTEGNKLIGVKSEFAYDISRISNGNQPFKGNVGIIGTNTVNNRELFHLLNNGTYQKGATSSDTNCMYVAVEETSPFMIFSFTEISTEIPVKVIDEKVQTSHKNVSPKTSDNTNIGVWGLLALGSGTFITRKYIKRRKYKR